eukprot:Em0003g1627a
MDDVLVADHTEAEHLNIGGSPGTFGAVRGTVEQAKCKFMLPSVEYLGFHISGDGVRPTQEKLHAIVDAPNPKDISQLKSFFGGQLLLKVLTPPSKHTLRIDNKTSAIMLGS